MNTSSKPRVLFTSAAVLLAAATFATAADNLWDGSSSNDWDDASNWSLNVIPTAPDFAVIDSTTNSPLINATPLSNPEGIFIGQGAGTSGSLTITAGTINLPVTASDNSINVGISGTGSIDIQGGVLNVQAFRLGINAGLGAGTATQSGGSINTINDFVVQQNGTGTMTMTGGTNTVGGNIYVGVHGSASTDSTTGLLNMSTGSGSFVATERILIGASSNTMGRLDIGGTSSITAKGLVLAGGSTNATATMNQTGGTITLNGATGDGNANFVIQAGATNSVGVYNLSGGTLNVGADSLIGNSASANSAKLNISGGTFNAGTNTGNQVLRLGIGANAGAEMTVSGTGIVNAEILDLGPLSGNEGRVTQTGGQVNISSDITMVRRGHYELSGGTLNVTNNIIISNTNTSQNSRLNVSGGTLNMGVGNAGNQEIQVGASNNNGVAGGELNLSGTGVINAEAVRVAIAASTKGTVTQTGGTLNVSQNLDIQGSGVGAYTLSGGTLSVNGTMDLTNGTFNFNGGTITRSNAGALVINGSLNTGSSSATLGVIPDTKTFSLSGTLDIADGLTFNLGGFTLPSLAGSGSFDLGTVGSIVGVFNTSNTNLTSFSNPAGLTFINENAVYNPLTDNVFFISETSGQVELNYNVVPEPSTVGLLALGAVACLRRRKRS